VRPDEGAPSPSHTAAHSESVLASEEPETIPFMKWENGVPRSKLRRDVLRGPPRSLNPVRPGRRNHVARLTRTRGAGAGRDTVLFRSLTPEPLVCPRFTRFAAENDAFQPNSPSAALRKLLAGMEAQLNAGSAQVLLLTRPHRAGNDHGLLMWRSPPARQAKLGSRGRNLQPPALAQRLDSFSPGLGEGWPGAWNPTKRFRKRAAAVCALTPATFASPTPPNGRNCEAGVAQL